MLAIAGVLLAASPGLVVAALAVLHVLRRSGDGAGSAVTVQNAGS
ncbi:MULTISPECIES: hypothetical protein [unclassified Pseudomonas]|nr:MULTISPECIES: hypothetical protein [unclassified Pseudomonas]